MSGELSYDPDDDIVSYKWTTVAGPNSPGMDVDRCETNYNPTKTKIFYNISNPTLTVFPPDAGIELFNEWYGAKRPVELHVYASGGHGLNAAPASAWVDRFTDWLLAQGFLNRRK